MPVEASRDRRIAPCPYSPRFVLYEKDAWQSLSVFFLYRLLLAFTLNSLHQYAALPPYLVLLTSELFGLLTVVYLVFVVLAGIFLLVRWPAYAYQAQFQVFSDILLLPCLIFALGGVGDGAGVLLGLSVAAGAFLVGGRCALLFAALASMAILLEEHYSLNKYNQDSARFIYAGFLGMSYFAVAFLALELARRAERSEALLEERGAEVSNLVHINDFIIRNLQTGILVVDAVARIRLLNEAARQLLHYGNAGALGEASPELLRLFNNWLKEPDSKLMMLRQAGFPDTQVLMSPLGMTRPQLFMIQLEDSRFYSRRVQIGKLASLGRLTASIAHEVRNPLGAIGHAGQLLAESPGLYDQDARLLQIILDQTARLNQVIENVLQISRRSDAHRDLLPIVKTLTRLLGDFEAERGLASGTFVLESEADDAEIAFDLSQLRQIMENLCANALQYGKPEIGPITVRVVRRFGKICIEFFDHGSPIDADTAASLFEPFFTKAVDGTGLGLYIARELAELNQARLEYEDVGEGSCFRLSVAEGFSRLVE